MSKFSRYAGFQIRGENVVVVTNAFKLFPEIGLRSLVQRGIGRADAKGKLTVEPSGGHPFPPRLEEHHEIAQKVGAAKMFDIGRLVAKHAVFPPELKDIYMAMGALDIAYHMNHGRNNAPLFDPATGTMQDGIGHLRTVFNPGEKRIEVIGNDPYPCAEEAGIVGTIAARFEPRAALEHLEKGRCRDNGGDQCRYVILW